MKDPCTIINKRFVQNAKLCLSVAKYHNISAKKLADYYPVSGIYSHVHQSIMSDRHSVINDKTVYFFSITFGLTPEELCFNILSFDYINEKYLNKHKPN